MTTCSASYEGSGAPGGAGAFLFAAFMLMFGYVFAAPIMQLAVPPDSAEAKVIETDHSTIAHGLEAVAIRACIAKSGVSQLWKTRSEKPGKSNKFFRVCELDDGRVGMQIVQWSWRAMAYREVTAFVVKDGRPAQLREYLSGIAVMVR